MFKRPPGSVRKIAPGIFLTLLFLGFRVWGLWGFGGLGFLGYGVWGFWGFGVCGFLGLGVLGVLGFGGFGVWSLGAWVWGLLRNIDFFVDIFWNLGCLLQEPC